MRLAILHIGVISILFSCGQSMETVRVLTDQPELASAVAIYNNLHENIHIILQHAPSIESSDIDTYTPDIIIGKEINSPAILDKLTPLESSAAYYPALSGQKNHRGETIIIPLSFELPLIIATHKVMEKIPDPMIIRDSDTKQLEETFMQRDSLNRLTRGGFSPNWNPLTYIDLLLLETWPPEGLIESGENANPIFENVKRNLNSWIMGSYGDLESDRIFNKRYRYKPDYLLISENRILFSRINFQDWVKLPNLTAKNLDIRYFAQGNKIPISSVVWGAQLKTSSSKEQAQLFLNWLLSPDTQKMLINRWEEEGLVLFGFLNGLSSLDTVNETLITEKFPIMRGMVPNNYYLSMQQQVPNRWLRIRDEVIIPWFRSALYTTESTPSFSTAYSQWDLSSLNQHD